MTDLLAQTPAAGLHVFCAHEAGALLACAILSPLVYAEDPQRCFRLWR